MHQLNMMDIDHEPANSSLVKPDDWIQDADTRKDTLYGVASNVVSTYVDLTADFSSDGDSSPDKKLEYSRLLISVGLLYLEFCDAIKEGDGMRVIRCWRYMFLVFKCTNRKNYAIEAFTLLAQYHFLLSKRQIQQLVWGRFINVHGLPARNIPCDLFMEHLNRVCKDAVHGLGANKTPQALVKVAKIVNVLDEVLKNFDQDNSIKERSGKHKVANFKKEMVTIVKVLVSENVLGNCSDGSRKHNTWKYSAESN